jgi:hypothetical protein
MEVGGRAFTSAGHREPASGDDHNADDCEMLGAWRRRSPSIDPRRFPSIARSTTATWRRSSRVGSATGAFQWTGETGSPIVSHATVYGGTILVGTFDGRVVAFPAGGCGSSTCSPQWDVAVGDVPNRSLTVGGEVAYATTNNGSLVAFASGGCGAATCPVLKTIAANADSGGIVVDAGRVLVPVAGGHLVAYGLPG